MKNTLRTILLCGAAAALLQGGTLSGRRVPSFDLPDMESKYHDIYDLRGKVVVLEVMQTTCPHCQALTERLEKIEDQYGKRIAILSIVVPPDNAETVKQFIARFRVHYPVLFDCGQATAALLEITPAQPTVTFPHLFLIDAKGMIRDDYDWTADEQTLTGKGLTDRIDELLAPKPAPKAAATKK
jgi:peroxiredoxin